MISSQVVDIIVLIFFGYSALIGFKRGLFNILVGIFGIYGASFFAWIFQKKAYVLAVNYLGIQTTFNLTIIFVLLWIASYFVAIVLAKLLTSIFKLTGVNFILRIVGSILNLSKAVLIVIVVLTLLTKVNKDLFQQSDMTKRFVDFGSKGIVVYHQALDEQKIDLKKAPEIIQDSVIIDDDFRYNLLGR